MLWTTSIHLGLGVVNEIRIDIQVDHGGHVVTGHKVVGQVEADITKDSDHLARPEIDGKCCTVIILTNFWEGVYRSKVRSARVATLTWNSYLFQASELGPTDHTCHAGTALGSSQRASRSGTWPSWKTSRLWQCGRWSEKSRFQTTSVSLSSCSSNHDRWTLRIGDDYHKSWLLLRVWKVKWFIVDSLKKEDSLVDSIQFDHVKLGRRHLAALKQGHGLGQGQGDEDHHSSSFEHPKTRKKLVM